MTKDSNILLHGLSLVRTRPTSLQLAIPALKDVPMWPAVAQAANPLNECRLGLQGIERVVAMIRNCHWQIALA